MRPCKGLLYRHSGVQNSSFIDALVTLRRLIRYRNVRLVTSHDQPPGTLTNTEGCIDLYTKHSACSLRAGRDQDEYRISSHVRFLLYIVELIDHILMPHAISQRCMSQQAGIEKKGACQKASQGKMSTAKLSQVVCVMKVHHDHSCLAGTKTIVKQLHAISPSSFCFAPASSLRPASCC